MLLRLIKNNFAITFIALIFVLNKGLLNGFPLLEHSAGRLISDGHENNLMNDLEGIYPFFVRHVSLSWSLWLVIAAQGLLLLYGFNQFYKLHFNSNKMIKLISLICFVSISSVDYYISLVSPHIFSFLALLYLYLIFKKAGHLAINIVILLSCLLMTPIQALIIIVICCCSILFKFILKWDIHLSRAITGIIIGIIAIVSITFINKTFEGDYLFIKNANITKTARSFERYIVTDFLKEKCQNGQVLMRSDNLCNNKAYFKHVKQNTFLYNQKSPLYSGNCRKKAWKKCWEAKRKDFGYLIENIESNRKYLDRMRLAWLSSTVKQLFFFEQEPLDKLNIGPIIEKYYIYDSRSYNHSSQSRKHVDFGFDNLIESMIVLISFILFLYKSISEPHKYLKYFITLFGILFLNAFTITYYQSATAAIQGRIIPIISLGFLILLFNSNFLKRFIKELSKYKIKKEL